MFDSNEVILEPTKNPYSATWKHAKSWGGCDFILSDLGTFMLYSDGTKTYFSDYGNFDPRFRPIEGDSESLFSSCCFENNWKFYKNNRNKTKRVIIRDAGEYFLAHAATNCLQVLVDGDDYTDSIITKYYWSDEFKELPPFEVTTFTSSLTEISYFHSQFLVIDNILIVSDKNFCYSDGMKVDSEVNFSDQMLFSSSFRKITVYDYHGEPHPLEADQMTSIASNWNQPGRILTYHQQHLHRYENFELIESLPLLEPFWGFQYHEGKTYIITDKNCYRVKLL